MAVTVNTVMILTILIPFFSGLLIFGLKKYLKKFCGELSTGIVIVVISILSILLSRVRQSETGILFGFYTTAEGNEFGPPVGVQFSITPGIAVMLLIINIIIASYFIYITFTKRNEAEITSLLSFSLIIVSGINGLLLSNDFLTLIICWVIIGFSFLFILIYQQTIMDIKSTITPFFILFGISIVFLFLAMILCYTLFGCVNFQLIMQSPELFETNRFKNGTFIIYFIIVLCILGFGGLVQLFLLNNWSLQSLTNHVQESGLIFSALISQLAIYSLFKVLFSVFSPTISSLPNYSLILLIFGFLTVFEGLLLLFISFYNKNTKTTIHSFLTQLLIFQSGLAVVLFSISGMVMYKNQIVTSLALNLYGYSLLYLLNAFCSLTLIIQSIFKMSNDRNETIYIEEFCGIMKERPITTLVFTISLFSLIGLLPTIGGVSIFMEFYTIILTGFWYLAIILSFTLLISVAIVLFLLKIVIFEKQAINRNLGENGFSKDITVPTLVSFCIAFFLILFAFIPGTILQSIFEGLNNLLS
ncbi:MAG: proton-conducting transporter membrane subunit [Asgard group archaeon]|nr:proton-conducting transporter membrane subunit [Asgard group archaeon]